MTGNLIACPQFGELLVHRVYEGPEDMTGQLVVLSAPKTIHVARALLTGPLMRDVHYDDTSLILRLLTRDGVLAYRVTGFVHDGLCTAIRMDS